MRRFISTSILATLLLAGPTHAELTKASLGKTADGIEVEEFTFKAKSGMIVKVMSLGATITEISVPDKNGKYANIVLGFDDLAGYQSERNQYFGCTTGRVANRIAKGAFTLGDKEFKLALNDGPNHLHGGAKRSLDKVVWKVAGTSPLGKLKDNIPGRHIDIVTFSYTSPDGEEGYPGKLDLRVSFRVPDKFNATSKNELIIHYSADTTKPTPVNLTNHTYFNLAGAGAETVLDHELTIPAESYLPTDDKLIPTGKIAPVAGTDFDFNQPTRIGARIQKLEKTPAKGYDLFYILKPMTFTPHTKLRDPNSGRVLTVWPYARKGMFGAAQVGELGMQLYTGNFLTGQKGRDGKSYKQHSAVCLETMDYPDAVNQPAFPSIILQPGRFYSQTCVYWFSTE